MSSLTQDKGAAPDDTTTIDRTEVEGERAKRRYAVDRWSNRGTTQVSSEPDVCRVRAHRGGFVPVRPEFVYRRS